MRSQIYMLMQTYKQADNGYLCERAQKWYAQFQTKIVSSFIINIITYIREKKHNYKSKIASALTHLKVMQSCLITKYYGSKFFEDIS